MSTHQSALNSYLHTHNTHYSLRDRKRKKFVGESGDSKTKKIRTESGALVKASYKTDAYQRWRDKYKIDAQLAGEEQEGTLPPTTAGKLTE